MAPTNLPIQLTSFVGREQELVELARLLVASRLVTLTGAGGCGKTRLALHAVNNMSAHFAGGIWLVDLVLIREPALVPQAVAQALGVHEPASQPVIESLQRFLQPKQLLLVLDNCEHLSDACASLVQTLLRHAPQLHILATSREALAVPGETNYYVPPLSLPPERPASRPTADNAGSPAEWLQYDAIRLFVERVRAVLPGFRLSAENMAVITNICRHLDGIPLAIELACARVRVLSLEQIAGRLEDRFSLLVSAQRVEQIPHHHTLRATLDWSYDLLTPAEQTLFRRLPVFVAGFTLDAAEAICAGEGLQPAQILDLLSSLVDKSLVVAETSGRAQARYRLLETIREYAQEKLAESGETARLRDRHLQLFLANAEESLPKQFEAYQQLWFNWLAGEHDNLRAALAWALESDQIEPGLRLANSLVRFWEIAGYVQEAPAWYDRLLAKVDGRVSLEVHVNSLVFAVFVAMFLHRIPAAKAYAQEAMELAEGIGDENSPVRAFALSGLSSAANAAGEYQMAFDIEEQAVRIFRQTGPSFHLGMGLLSQGTTAIELGRYEIARELLAEGLSLARQDGDAFRIAHAMNALGDLARLEQNYPEAAKAYESGAALMRELGAERDLASFLCNQGFACLRLGAVERAYLLFGDSMTIHQAQQDRLGMSECLIGFAATAVMDGQPAAGARLLAAVMAINSRPATSEAPRPSPWKATQMEFDWYLQHARDQLTEAAFQAEQMAGQALSLEEAIQHAQDLSRKPAGSAHERNDGLTGREREVAGLIALGKSNSEIAAELVLSKRTVEKHIANILSKLGLTSRTQIVRWALENIPADTPG